MRLNILSFPPEWLVGFTDADGSFTIAIKKAITKVGYQVFLMFAISQSVPREWILKEIQTFFNCGRIVQTVKSGAGKDGISRNDAYQYHVYAINDIMERIIPFFDKYPPILKREDYELWKVAAKMIMNKEHLTEEGLAKLMKMKKELH